MSFPGFPFVDPRSQKNRFPVFFADPRSGKKTGKREFGIPRNAGKETVQEKRTCFDAQELQSAARQMKSTRFVLVSRPAFRGKKRESGIRNSEFPDSRFFLGNGGRGKRAVTVRLDRRKR